MTTYSNTFLERGEVDNSIIGYRIIGINYEVAYPCGFNLVIRVQIGEIENRNYFFGYDRETFALLKPMELVGKLITNVEYVMVGAYGGTKITVEDGSYVWFKQT